MTFYIDKYPTSDPNPRTADSFTCWIIILNKKCLGTERIKKSEYSVALTLQKSG